MTELVCTAAEHERLARLGKDHWATVLFSAKESIYKAWFPIGRHWLDHQGRSWRSTRSEARSGPGSWPPRNRRLPWPELEGRFATDADRVYTAVVLPYA